MGGGETYPNYEREGRGLSYRWSRPPIICEVLINPREVENVRLNDGPEKDYKAHFVLISK